MLYNGGDIGVTREKILPDNPPPFRRPPNWNWDECILLLDVYKSNLPHFPGKNSSDLQRLSDDLRQWGRTMGRDVDRIYRNADGIEMRMRTILSLDESNPRKGLGIGEASQTMAGVWDFYNGKNAELKKVAASVRKAIRSQAIAEEIVKGRIIAEEGVEGGMLTVVHRVRERDGKIVKLKKEKVFGELGKLECEVCTFDYHQKYGARGYKFMECHHIKPISALAEESVTTLDDLALLCANCHRMVHVRQPWLDMGELRGIVNI